VTDVTGMTEPDAHGTRAAPPGDAASAARPADYLAAVAALQRAYAAIPPGRPVRLAKRTSNLFRFRDAGPSARLRPGGTTAPTPPARSMCPPSTMCCASTRGRARRSSAA
jgi:hypothetical protein